MRHGHSTGFRPGERGPAGRQRQRKDAYREVGSGGYPGTMLQRLTETLFTTTAMLWIFASAAAAALLFGAMTGRRASLTAALRDHVSRHRSSGDGPAEAAEKE